MTTTPVKIIFGSGGTGSLPQEEMEERLKTLEKYGVRDIDTAWLYPGSEVQLGKVEAPLRFTIHGKAPGFTPGIMTKQNVLDGMETSLQRLGVDKMESYLLHAPDPQVPIEETLSAIQEIYAAGKFKYFGLSNFLPSDVQKIYDIQLKASSVLPTVYQGNYNPVARHSEQSLFPLLRKLKIAFYAYSPIAGGFLVKSAASLRAQDDYGRFGPNARTGEMYKNMYGKESLFQAVERWGDIATEAGITKAALAYRWVAWHSVLNGGEGDGMVIGASRVSQLVETLEAIKEGPLPDGIPEKIEEVWRSVERDAPLDNWNSFGVTQQEYKVLA